MDMAVFSGVAKKYTSPNTPVSLLMKDYKDSVVLIENIRDEYMVLN